MGFYGKFRAPEEQEGSSFKLYVQNSNMKSAESVAEYISRVITTVNQMRIHGDKKEVTTVVEKILRSMTPKFNFVVCAIEESKDIDELSLDELQSSQLASPLPILSFTYEKIGETYLELKSAPVDAARAVIHRALITDMQNKWRVQCNICLFLNQKR